MRKFSWKWFVSIHLPIPLVILLRIGLGFSWWYVPVSLSCAVTGQIVGGILYVRLRRRRALAAAAAAKSSISGQYDRRGRRRLGGHREGPAQHLDRGQPARRVPRVHRGQQVARGHGVAGAAA